MLLLDVEKAFDSVWHDALLHKLIQRGFNIFLARIIHYFLSGHNFQVSVGKSKSSVCNIPYGVLQGAFLSPTLYIIYSLLMPPRPMSVSLRYLQMTLPYLYPSQNR
jgi:hypothetical protein